MTHKVLIIGYGSSGKRYFRIIKKKFPNYIVKVFSRSYKKKNFCLKKFSEINLFNPDSIFFCNPSTKRMEFLDLIKRTNNIFFEKPLTNNYYDAKQLMNLIQNKNNILIGYNLRFFNILNIIKKNLNKYVGTAYSFNCECGYHLSNWRNVNYLDTVSAQRKLGGGALLELSHELDYIHWIFGTEYKSSGFYTNSNLLKINVEDNVKIIFKFRNKILGSLSLDFLSLKKKRFLEVNGSKGILKINLIKNDIKLYNKRNHNWKEIKFKKNNTNETYEEVVKYFFGKNKTKKNISTIHDSIFTLRSINNIIKENKKI